MRYRKRKEIEDFFGVSIVMSFYKKLHDFKRVLPKNATYFQRNGIEVIIVMDEPSEEKDLLEFIQTYPFINFKVIVNRKEHPWRNHCKVLNVGIRHASFEHILILDPEVELVTDVIYQLRYILHNYPNSYATGTVAFIEHEDDLEKLKNPNWMPYGNIMAKKEDLFAIRGYEESFEEWGGEDDQIRKRLELFGIQKAEALDAKAVHREEKSDGHLERSRRIQKMPIKLIKHIFYPKKPIFNDKHWGLDFRDVVWDWAVDKSFDQLTQHCLSKFERYDFLDKEISNKDYEIVALIQVRNESKHIPEILNHLDAYCDGIVLLDDGSTDGSYEIATHDKLLIKTKKTFKGFFDDLENRNMLLRLASFIKSEWFFFIDADERFDPRFGNIREQVDKNDIDVYRFQLVDMWDNPDTYRVDMPDNRNKGIATRARMFRNKGSMQIYTNREIHFPAVPYLRKINVADLLLLHYGNYDKRIRKRKYDLYTKQDSDGKKQAHDYKFLKDDNVTLKPLKHIILIQNIANETNI